AAISSCSTRGVKSVSAIRSLCPWPPSKTDNSFIGNHSSSSACRQNVSLKGFGIYARENQFQSVWRRRTRGARQFLRRQTAVDIAVGSETGRRAHRNAAAGHVHQGHRADLPKGVWRLSSPRLRGAD